MYTNFRMSRWILHRGQPSDKANLLTVPTRILGKYLQDTLVTARCRNAAELLRHRSACKIRGHEPVVH